MSDVNAAKELSLWDSLPANERKMIEKRLKKMREDEPTPGKKPRPQTFQLKGYVRCELSASDKESFKEWEAQHSAEEAFGSLVKAADSGYLIKVGEQGQGGQASLCASTTGTDWDGYVLTAHAGNAIRAAVLLVFKHEIIMQRDWSAWLEEGGEDALR